MRFLGTRFTRVIAGDERLLHVDLAYDLPTGVSIVTFIPLEAGETSVRIQTDDDLVHLFKISVRTLVTPPPPNPPTNVAVIPARPFEFRNTFKPAMVLIWFTPTNPEQLSQTVGFSTNAAFYRKPAGASDAEYVRLDNPDDPLVPLNREQIHDDHAEVPVPGGARRRVGADRADRNDQPGRPGAGDHGDSAGRCGPARAGSRHGNPASRPGRRGTDQRTAPRCLRLPRPDRG